MLDKLFWTFMLIAGSSCITKVVIACIKLQTIDLTKLFG